MVLLFGEAEVSHRRAGEKLERDLDLRRSEEGSAPRVAERDFTGAIVSNLRYDRIFFKMVLCSFSTLCPKALALIFCLKKKTSKIVFCFSPPDNYGGNYL